MCQSLDCCGVCLQVLMQLHAAVKAAATAQLPAILGARPWSYQLASGPTPTAQPMLSRALHCRQEVSTWGQARHLHVSLTACEYRNYRSRAIHETPWHFCLDLRESLCLAANGQQQGTLVLQGSEAMPFLGADISPLTLSIQNLDQNILGVKIGAPGRWEVPQDRLFSNTAQGV